MARAAKATTAKTFAECTLIAPETLAGVAVLAKLEGTEPPEDKTFVNAVASAAAFVPVVAEVTVVVSDVRETPEEGVTVVVTVNVLAAMTLTRLPLLLLLVPERKEGAKRFKTPALAEAEAAEEGETALILARKTTFQLLISEVLRTTSRLLRTEETLTVKTTGAGVGAGVAPVTNTVGTIAQSRLTFEEERELVSMTICVSLVFAAGATTLVTLKDTAEPAVMAALRTMVSLLLEAEEVDPTLEERTTTGAAAGEKEYPVGRVTKMASLATRAETVVNAKIVDAEADAVTGSPVTVTAERTSLTLTAVTGARTTAGATLVNKL